MNFIWLREIVHLNQIRRFISCIYLHSHFFLIGIETQQFIFELKVILIAETGEREKKTHRIGDGFSRFSFKAQMH